MKTSFFEKSTWKGIFAGLAVCGVFFLGAFAAEIVSLSGLKIESPERLLQQAKWNNLIDAMGGVASTVDANLKNSVIPKGTVIIFADNGNPCPPGWSQWSGGGKDKFLIPLQSSEGTTASVQYGGMKNFVITKENLPKHSHTIMVDHQGTPGLSPTTSLAVTNVSTTNNGDADYHLVGSSSTPTVGKTSEWGGNAAGNADPIEFMPEYAKVLFCVKD